MMKTLKVTLISGKGRERSLSVSSLWLFGGLAMAALLCLFIVDGSLSRKLTEEGAARANVQPLDARDPSALVMTPYFGKCSCPCPTAEKPR